MKDKITEGKQTEEIIPNKILKNNCFWYVLRLWIIFIFLYFSGFSKISIYYVQIFVNMDLYSINKYMYEVLKINKIHKTYN